MRWVLADDGARLHVDVHEPSTPHGPTVVFTHGYAQSSACWHHQVAALGSAGHRVVIWDLRAHGRSVAGPEGPWTIERITDDLAAVIQATVPDGDLVLVGHSMGGMAVMALAEQHPELVRRVLGVAFVSTAADNAHLAWLGLGDRATPYVQKLAGLVFGRLATHEHAWRLVSWTGPLADAATWIACCGWRTSWRDTLLTVEAAHGGGFVAMRDFLPALLANDRTHALEAWRGVESLVLNGSADLLIPGRCSDEIAAALPGSRRVSVRAAGHNVMLAGHRQVDTELLALVRRASAPTT